MCLLTDLEEAQGLPLNRQLQAVTCPIIRKRIDSSTSLPLDRLVTLHQADVLVSALVSNRMAVVKIAQIDLELEAVFTRQMQVFRRLGLGSEAISQTDSLQQILTIIQRVSTALVEEASKGVRVQASLAPVTDCTVHRDVCAYLAPTMKMALHRLMQVDKVSIE